MATKGLFIVIEGVDGAGKSTQLHILTERLKASGHEVEIFKFPRYDQPSSHFIRKYLNGDYGRASSITPYTASLFYALDRFEAAPEIKKALAAGKVVVADRYVGSNMAHQGSKLTDSVEQRSFFVWDDSLEYQLLGIPRPDINIILKVSPDSSYKMISQKKPRAYTDKSHDEHEKDLNHLKKTATTYDLMAGLFPKDFKIIDCQKDGKLLSVTEINNRLWREILALLPPPVNPGRSIVLNLNQPFEEPRAQIDATLSILASDQSGSAAKTRFEMKNISFYALDFLLTQPGINIEYQSPWQSSKNPAEMKYYVPPNTPNNLISKYLEFIESLKKTSIGLSNSLEAYSAKNRPEKKAQDLAVLQALIPLSGFCSATITGDKRGLKDLLAKLKTTQNPEFKKIAAELEKVVKDETKANFSGPPAGQILQRLIEDYTPTALSSYEEPLKLLEASPRNELDLLIDTLYPYSGLSTRELAAELDRWPYDQKLQLLKAALAEKADSLLQKARYRWDAIDDHLLFYALSATKLMRDIYMQPPSVRYGYEVPEIIEEAGLGEDFITCFDLSLEAYSHMQAGGHEQLAAYSCLLGHKIRWQFETTAKDIVTARPSKKIDAGRLRSFLVLISEKISEAQPNIGQLLMDAAAAKNKKPAPQKETPQIKRPTAGKKRKTTHR